MTNEPIGLWRIIWKFTKFSENYFAVLVVLGSIAGFLHPPIFSWAMPYISLFLGIIMFGMGMTLKVSDFEAILERPIDVVFGTLLQFTLMPILALVVSYLLSLPPEIAIGVILLGACPGGTASNVITYLAKGDVALSVAITSFSTLIAPLLTPLIVLWSAGHWINVSTISIFVSIVQIVAIPVFMGIFINNLLGKKIDHIRQILPLISVFAIVIIVGAIIGANAEKIVFSGIVVILAVIIHNILGLLLGYTISKMAKIDEKKVRAISIEVGVQNSGLAVALATIHFSPLAAVPGALFSVWHNITGPILANYWSKKDKKDKYV
ncbi:Bile acid:sodium symporter [Methanococcus vannielii SB]|uniref:Bile acid:sodium symporter n=1 Tax=Methanococcus vannielii (strain ATCC 35089 / DSM 1224 / JCM 13029 / OCM 148 / SB) TaxID=406327 RepID=A6USG1_METVS|nr:bile acid:sodium symporter family protein [Methanococcus vannielii]ABR55433.1 Bile acid:sodium symporter [Methanococcus vannielii SB]